MLEKARDLPCDVVVLDLEDSVAPESKDAARDTVCAAVKNYGRREVVVRINAAGTPWHRTDLKAVRAAGPHAILLPKAQSAADIEAVEGALPIWAMIETPRSVLNAAEIAGAGVAALVLGSNDLLKDMGARHMPGRANLHTAMALCVMAGRAAGITVLDGVHNDLNDMTAFAIACQQARDFGFDGKTLIHPGQIAVCNAAFTPSPEEIAAARRVVEAFAKSPQAGVIALDGRMVERLDLKIAERTLSRAP